MERTIMSKQPLTLGMLFIAVLLVGFLSVNLTTDYCWGSALESVAPAITLDVKNEPLRSVLGKISKTTRWQIKAPDKWMDKPVTQTLNKVTLEEGLRSVLKSAGVENLLLMYDENIRVVTLFDIEGAQKQAAGRPPAPIRAEPLVSSTGRPDPILERAAERNAGAGSLRGSRRSRRPAGGDDD
jgi:hypothetical protein